MGYYCHRSKYVYHKDFVVEYFIHLLAFTLDKHVSFAIMHLENEPVIQKMIADMDNTTAPGCLAAIKVSFSNRLALAFYL